MVAVDVNDHEKGTLGQKGISIYTFNVYHLRNSIVNNSRYDKNKTLR
jgi:hypothetical protein